MQKTIYICDQCQKEIGDKKHISVAFGGPVSGIAVPPNKGQQSWGVHHKLNNSFRHFCNGSCIGHFFSDLMKKVTNVGVSK